MARPTANTRKVAADKRKTKENKEESKEINYDDDYLALSDGTDKDQYEGETKEPPDEEGDPKSDISSLESENLEEAKPKSDCEIYAYMARMSSNDEWKNHDKTEYWDSTLVQEEW